MNTEIGLIHQASWESCVKTGRVLFPEQEPDELREAKSLFLYSGGGILAKK
jgi:hypothetical protein